MASTSTRQELDREPLGHLDHVGRRSLPAISQGRSSQEERRRQADGAHATMLGQRTPFTMGATVTGRHRQGFGILFSVYIARS